MTFDSLDIILNYLYEKKDYVEFPQVVKDNSEIDCELIINILEKDGYLTWSESAVVELYWKYHWFH